VNWISVCSISTKNHYFPKWGKKARSDIDLKSSI